MASDITNIENINTISEGVQQGIANLATGASNAYINDKNNLDAWVSKINESISGTKGLLNSAIQGIDTAIEYSNNVGLNSTLSAEKVSSFIGKELIKAEQITGKYSWGRRILYNSSYPNGLIQVDEGNAKWTNMSQWLPAYRTVLSGYRGSLQTIDASPSSIIGVAKSIASVQNVGGDGTPRGGAMKSIFTNLNTAYKLSKKVESEKDTNTETQTQNTASTETLDTGKFTRERAVEALKNKKASETLGFGSV